MSVAPKYLLDASALLALIQNEDGADRVAAVLDKSCIHAVNLVEVVRKLVQKGLHIAEATALLSDLHLDVIEELYEKQAYQMGNPAWQSVSLGDVVCLLVGQFYEHTIVTADRRWSKLEGVSQEIVQIRPAES